MNQYEFGETLIRLENYLGIKVSGEGMVEYFRRFGRKSKEELNRAIDILVDEHEIKTFPLVPEFQEALQRAAQERGPAIETDDQAAVFCQACSGLGLVLTIDGQTVRSCGCLKGRIKQAAWQIPSGMPAGRKEKKIEKLLHRLPEPGLPTSGLKEWNHVGFWEDTQEEHDRWMAAKWAQIQVIDAQRSARPEPPPRTGEATWKKTIQETLGKLAEPMDSPPDDGEEIPF